jgi:hypothetical protein
MRASMLTWCPVLALSLLAATPARAGDLVAGRRVSYGVSLSKLGYVKKTTESTQHTDGAKQVIEHVVTREARGLLGSQKTEDRRTTTRVAGDSFGERTDVAKSMWRGGLLESRTIEHQGDGVGTTRIQRQGDGTLREHFSGVDARLVERDRVRVTDASGRLLSGTETVKRGLPDTAFRIREVTRRDLVSGARKVHFENPFGEEASAEEIAGARAMHQKYPNGRPGWMVMFGAGL